MSIQTNTNPPPPPSAPSVSPSRGSRVGWLFILALLIAVGVGVALWWKREKEVKAAAPTPKHETTSEHAVAVEGSGTPRVEVVHPKKGGITRTSSQSGSVHAFEEAELYAKVSGYLKVLSVDIGDRVKEGQVLAEIDDPEIVKEADRTKAALVQSKAMVTQANAHIKTSEANLKAAEAMVGKSKADVERYTSTRRFREKELARFKALRAKNAIPQEIVDEEIEHLDSAIAAEHSAQAEVITSQAQVVSAQATVDQAKADLAEAEANVEVAESNLAKAKVMVDYTRIISPYTGVVTFRGFHRGAFIRSAEGGGEKPILTVAKTDKVRVVTYIPDRDVPFTDVGDKALINLDALPGETFEGKVTRFAETEDPSSRTMRTEVDLQNPDNRLREGMYGIATVVLQEVKNGLTIPASCLTGKAEQGKASVFVVRDGKAKLVSVRIGADDGLRVEVLDGLRPDDNVVMNTGLVTEGAEVEPVETPAPATAAAAG